MKADEVSNYIFRAVRREPDGTIGPTLHEKVIQAENDNGAVAKAKMIDLDFETLGANAIYLAGPSGRAIWSLHIGSAR